MESAELVTRLLEGQQNVDRMKKEIDLVVAMLFGYAKKSNIEYDESRREHHFEKRFDSAGGYWIIQSYQGLNGLTISWHLKGEVFATYRYCRQRSEGVQIMYTQTVFESLPDLVEGVRREFPVIEELWQPLIKASEVKVKL